ncbi:Pvc16 family protein [Streptomyces sp. NPDC005355]|uniref:Pvc16 family protein n=1 Tax=Streptomyces sp. NPDC005355 TaxID=3157038 RepID=UPI0033A4E3D7
MFQDLDATLKALLGAAGAPAEVRAAEVSFDTPDKDFSPAQSTVNLFLHDVQENRVLRNDAPLLDRNAAGWTARRTPLRVDCTYLTTTWSPSTGGLKAAEEHRLLGLTLEWLSRFPEIEERFLMGGLTSPPQLYPLPLTVAQVQEGQGTGQFWTALGVAPRPAFSLTVTVGLPAHEAEERYPAFKGLRIEMASMGQPALAGRVLDNALSPVASAQVTVVEADRQVMTDRAGGFTFDGLEFGTYTLLVRFPGRPDVHKPVDYRADGQVHDVIFPGP